MKKVYLQKPDGNAVECLNCAHYCSIAPNKRGMCQVRENRHGELVALNYGQLAGLQAQKIENIPLFHFLPGSSTLAIGSAGCNMMCANCQTWNISQKPRLSGDTFGHPYEPQEIIDIAQSEGCQSISYSYTSPAIFSEFAYDTMRLAHEAGLKNVWDTNGYWSKELFEMIAPYLDAANIDIKAFSDNFYKTNCNASLQPVLDTCKRLKDAGIWLEISTLLIPEANDSQEMLVALANYIKTDLGEETPWHISAFDPQASWKLENASMPDYGKLVKIAALGNKAGLYYVYLPNSKTSPQNNTFCPKCKDILIERNKNTIKRFDEQLSCQKCGGKISGVI